MSNLDDPARSRLPIDAARVHSLLAGSGVPDPVLLASVGSTNAEAEVLTAHLASVVAEEQVSGRGRQGRVWSSPPGCGLWVSVLVRTDGVDPARRTWLPLVAGLAAAEAVSGVRVDLKWPNDLVVDRGATVAKLGGILAEAIDESRVVVGIGINIAIEAAALPFAGATSVQEERGDLDREELLARLLLHLREFCADWSVGGGQWAAREEDYRRRCITIGRSVRVSLPGDGVLEGRAIGVDDQGALLVDTEVGTRTVAAGDVVHATI